MIIIMVRFPLLCHLCWHHNSSSCHNNLEMHTDFLLHILCCNVLQSVWISVVWLESLYLTAALHPSLSNSVLSMIGSKTGSANRKFHNLEEKFEFKCRKLLLYFQISKIRRYLDPSLLHTHTHTHTHIHTHTHTCVCAALRHSHFIIPWRPTIKIVPRAYKTLNMALPIFGRFMLWCSETAIIFSESIINLFCALGKYSLQFHCIRAQICLDISLGKHMLTC